jgi:hypothetical protein
MGSCGKPQVSHFLGGVMDGLESQLRNYRSRHRSPGCKITHMVGVPLIALSLPMFFVNRQCAWKMFGVGWTLQFIGHICFEHNRPAFTEDPKNPFTYLSALAFVAGEWRKVVVSLASGRFYRGGYGETDLDSDIPKIQEGRPEDCGADVLRLLDGQNTG